MKITTVLFDLDGTLLPMDQDLFIKAYFKGLAARLAPCGYDPHALIDSIWKGTAAMVSNDGSRSNEETFWNYFASVFGEDARQDEPKFRTFYETEFQNIQKVCGYTSAAREVIDLVHQMGYRAVLATNPIFPAIATESRMRWAGLAPSDFEYYTTYENSTCCKPNPAYYTEILNKLGLCPKECVMVGNDAVEDTAALKAGIPQVFLLTDCLINKSGQDLIQYPQGGFRELTNWLKQLND